MNLLKTSVLVIAVVVLVSPPALGDEPSLLERLNAETTKLAERARVVTARLSWGQYMSEAVLVGSPPRFVTSYEPMGRHENVTFVLSGGRSGAAKRVAGEPELGLAVYEPVEPLPMAGLPVESRWAVPRGSVAVLGGMQPRLLLMSGRRGPRDGLRLAEENAVGVLLGADGRLLGFRPSYKGFPGLSGPYHYSGTGTGTYTGRVTMPLNVVTDKDGVWRLVPLQPVQQRARLVSPPPAEKAEKKDEKDEKVAKGRVVDGEGKPLEVAHLAPPVMKVEPLVVSLYTPITPHTPQPAPSSVLPPKAFLPGALIHRVLSDLEAHGKVRHAYLGVVPASPEKGSGARLVTVLADSPAAKAGLKEGDLITVVNGQRVTSVATLTKALVLRSPGDRLTVVVKGRKKPIHVFLGAQSEARRELPTPQSLGFEVVEVTPELTAFLGMSDLKAGVAVRAVKPRTPAAQAGLKRGDVIVKGGGHPTRDVEELLAALAGAKPRIALTIRREGVPGEQLLHLRLPAAKARPGPR